MDNTLNEGDGKRYYAQWGYKLLLCFINAGYNVVGIAFEAYMRSWYIFMNNQANVQMSSIHRVSSVAMSNFDQLPINPPVALISFIDV